MVTLQLFVEQPNCEYDSAASYAAKFNSDDANGDLASLIADALVAVGTPRPLSVLAEAMRGIADRVGTMRADCPMRDAELGLLNAALLLAAAWRENDARLNQSA